MNCTLKKKTKVSLDSTNDSWINISYPSWSFLTPSYIATAYRISALKFYHHLVIELGRSTITLNIECPQPSFQGSWVPISQIALTPPLSRSLKMETLHYGGSFPFLHSPCLQSALRPLVSFLSPGETLLPWGHGLDITPYPLVASSFPATVDNSLLSTSPPSRNDLPAPLCLISSSIFQASAVATKGALSCPGLLISLLWGLEFQHKNLWGTQTFSP